MPARSSARYLIALLPASARASYIELPGLRCFELHQQYPIGDKGVAWHAALLDEAKTACDGQDACTGVMRYIGSQEPHCHDWCGRPQFCVDVPADQNSPPMSPNPLWVSYIKSEYIESLGMSHSALRNQLIGSEPLSTPLEPGQQMRQVSCGEFRGNRCERPVVLISTALARSAIASRSPPRPGACHVLYQPAEKTPLQPDEYRNSFIDGNLTEIEDELLPVFSASTPDQDFSPGSGPPGAPRRYFADAVPVFPDVTGLRKKHILSVYFLSRESFCPGPNGTALTPESARRDLLNQHVYVEDGTRETLEAAFKEYHFTLLCGDFSTELFPPLALVYSLAHVTHAMAPEYIHWKASRLFYHLPDAAQGVRTIQAPGLEAYLEHMISDPSKEKIMEFKETFTLLSQTLFRYRYQETAARRAETAACALCDSIAREERRKSVAHQPNISVTRNGANDDAVAVVFCVMSRRGAHELRQVVRETWGRGLAGKAPAVVQRFFVGSAANDTHILHDVDKGDVVELAVVESYRTLNLKAFSMMTWAHRKYPNLQWLVRHDDDVYLRATALLAQLSNRPPVRYMWGMFDHGSSPVRDPSHQHYNSYAQFPKQAHPAWGDIFPPYARGILWAMSADLLAEVVADFIHDVDAQPGVRLDEASAEMLPHPDDPAVGVVIRGLMQKGMSINLDDRDFNSFSLNPACNSTFSNIHNRTWIVHHVKPETMRCMWELDTAEDAAGVASHNSAIDASNRLFPDLCLCSANADVEEIEDGEEEPFWYDRQRFNSAR
eukprot:TRINITY_DN12466_c0_g1_i1.p1 TRINITY_DN12466_c0_g1~~TRINITY_DN12466_c0_g1_i1.p1  ORF type:complete len:778 (-),score=68.96 TRINITY_DN12466_c0_g1_i1:204-2537(-)